jgi:hypothetical protein
MRTGLVLPYM